MRPLTALSPMLALLGMADQQNKTGIKALSSIGVAFAKPCHQVHGPAFCVGLEDVDTEYQRQESHPRQDINAR